MDSFTSEQIQETKNQEFEFLNSIDPIKPIQVRKIPSSFPQYNWPSYIKKDPFLWNCTKRVHYENKNNLIVWVGETGIGKSETASSAADAMDITPLGGEQFTRNFIIKDDGKGNPVPECRAFFRGADLLRHVRSGLPKGSHLLWDEAGIDNDNTKWYEKKSKLVKYILQTFRFKNLTLHMTVPDIESITLGTRRLVHCVIDVQERNTQAARCKIAWLHRVRRLKKTIVYPKMPAYVDKETGKDTLVTNYWVPKLRADLQEPYLRIKDKVMDNLYDFYEGEMSDLERIEKMISPDANLKENEKLAFNVVECISLVQNNIKDVIIEGVPNKDKIIYFLGKNGYECSGVNAKTVLTNLQIPPEFSG